MYDHAVSPEYRRYLKGHVWKARKAEFWANHRRRCEACDKSPIYRPWWKFWIKRRFIVVHHKRYDEQIATPGREPDDALAALCSPGCHQEVHARYRDGQFRTLEQATDWLIQTKQDKLARKRMKEYKKRKEGQRKLKTKA